MAWFVLLAGVVASVAAATVWRAQARRQVEHSFAAEAAGVGSTVTTALMRMDDLTVAARALIASERDVSNRKLASWYASVGAERRYPGIVGFGYIRFVPAAQLPSFTAQLRRDPVPGLAVGQGRLKIVASGSRPYYCLARLGVAAAVNQFLVAPGLDYCSIQGFGALESARDSGQFVSFTLGGRLVAVFAPVYRGGTDLPSITLRRARISGVVAGLFDVKSILGQARIGHRDLQIGVVRRDVVPTADATSGIAKQFAARVGTLSAIASGRAVSGAVLRRRLTVDADGHWIVTVSKSPDATLLTPDVQALVMLVGGVILSALAFLLVQTLSSGRARALRTVHERTQQLRHQALHDGLTGLPNRQLLSERAAQLLNRARREHTQVAAMFMDIDGFKGVNDSFGHLAGDELLRAAAARIVKTLRTTDSVGRIGGDEFVVLAEGRHSDGDPELLAKRLLDAFREPFELRGPDGVLLSVTVSIGLAIGDRPDAEELMRDADIALYSAKAAGRNRYVVFQPEMRVALQDRVSLENDLRRAIANGELTLMYQPTFELRDGRLTGMEALLRWHHPIRGLLGPSEFVSIAEESGLIVELGAWAINRACAQAAEWQALGHDIDVSVNVSARQLDDPGLLHAVREGLHKTGLPAGSLTLEITETALMRDPNVTAARLQALKHLGVRVAIDDFGTGYSSLAYLHQFPVDALKIDRAFVSGIARSPEAKALIRTLVQLATSLGIDSVAEGIENEMQHRFLLSEGCRCGQGFLFARPMDVEAMQAFLQARTSSGAVATQ